MTDEHIHHGEKKDNSIRITKSGLWQIISGILGVLLVISIFTSGFGVGGENSGTGVVRNQPSAGDNQGNNNIPSGIVDVSADDDPFMGDKNAPVTIIEFSDFQCPFCRRFWSDTLSQIKTQYIDTGKVKLVYRDFPLDSIHPGAKPAAEAAECAEDQGKFWEMHDKIFEEQNKQGQGTVQFGVTDLKNWAGELGLDQDKFDSCLDDGKYADEVAKDFQDGAQAGVQGTPSFFINGKQLSGAQPFAAFQQAIDAELA